MHENSISPRRVFPSVVGLLLLVLLASSVGAVKIKTGSHPDADFPSYRTYAWRPLTGPDADEGPDIRSAANKVLAEKGLRKVSPEDDPDIWLEYAVGSADMLYADWGLRLGWWDTVWAVPEERSRVSETVLVVISSNGRGKTEDKEVWGGRIEMEGNNPEALFVMDSLVGKETRKMMNHYPGLK